MATKTKSELQYKVRISLPK